VDEARRRENIGFTLHWLRVKGRRGGRAGIVGARLYCIASLSHSFYFCFNQHFHVSLLLPSPTFNWHCLLSFLLFIFVCTRDALKVSTDPIKYRH
jgi:hypothetical protein